MKFYKLLFIVSLIFPLSTYACVSFYTKFDKRYMKNSCSFPIGISWCAGRGCDPGKPHTHIEANFGREIGYAGNSYSYRWCKIKRGTRSCQKKKR